MIKPDARIPPTEEEFQAWQDHPTTRFVAAAYEAAAAKQRAEWDKYFHAVIVPADLAMIRLELKTREDAYRAFLETTFEDLLAFVDPDSRPRHSGERRAGNPRLASR